MEHHLSVNTLAEYWQPSGKGRFMKDMQLWEVVAMTPLAVFMVAIGIFPAPIINLINAAAVEILKRVS
jgi:NADH:ubiquinone oxidoreductase subunit 4 (subunit M)